MDIQVSREEAFYIVIGMEDGWLKYNEKEYRKAKMTWKECLEWQAKEKAFLDTKDLKPFIEKDKSIYDIMSDIEDAFEKEYTLEEYLFNHMDHHDVVKYLQDRYDDVRFYTYEDERVR